MFLMLLPSISDCIPTDSLKLHRALSNFTNAFIRDFLVNFTREFLIKNFYEGFPCKMNREKIKGVSFAGKSL